jgi:hypothetical protein
MAPVTAEKLTQSGNGSYPQYVCLGAYVILAYSLLLSLGGIIVISVIVLIIIKCVKKNDYEKLTKEVNAISFINKDDDKSEDILS